MKVVLLAGGFGTRIAEESSVKPKPMVEIGNMPILWHIMKTYSHYGFNEFVVCAGYKQHMIKKFFSDYFLHTSDITFDFTQDKETMIVHKKEAEPWKVTIVDTGINTMTGGRVKRIQKYIDEDDFLLTYGDGVADIKINELVEFGKKNISCVAEGEVLSFGAGEKKNDFSDMWTIIMRLTRSKWFLNYATSCTWNENNKSEDVLAQIKRKQMISA